MNDSSVDKKVIAKNAIYLYVRMLLILCVNFYAVRLLLKELGISDFGTYNFIFGLVSVYLIFSNALARMVQRFLCYELGKGNFQKCRLVFSTSLLFLLLISLFILLVSETAGVWLVFHKLNVPPNRIFAAKWTYQFLIVTIILKTIQMPYTAAIIACEKMKVLAKISIIEAIGTLLCVCSIYFIPGDKLILYPLFYSMTCLIVALCYIVYCNKNFDICKPLWTLSCPRIAQMFNFFLCGSLGGVVTEITNQGMVVMLNTFGGVVMNSTWALTKKVNEALSRVSVNFQTAFDPQIIKSYANKSNDVFFNLVVSTSRYSFLLCWVVVLPILLYVDWFLCLWLGNKLPPNLTTFVSGIIYFSILEAINVPLWIAVQANGKWGRYQVHVLLLTMLTMTANWMLLASGKGFDFVPTILVTGNIFLWIYRVIYLKIVFKMPLNLYVRKVLFPIACIISVSLSVGCLWRFLCGVHIGTILTVAIFNCIIVFLLGLSTSEKIFVIQWVKKKVLYKK